MMMFHFHCALTHTHLSAFTQVRMCHLSSLPCGTAGYFPTLTTCELTVLSVGIKKKKRMHGINMSSRTLITRPSALTGNSKQPPSSDLWTELPIYQLVISTLPPLIRSGNATFKWHTLELGKSGALLRNASFQHRATNWTLAVITLFTSLGPMRAELLEQPLSNQRWCKGELNCPARVTGGLGLTLLLRQITGHRLQPTVQQQHRQPQRSHFTLTGKFFFKQAFTLLMLVLNSSGAT